MEKRYHQQKCRSTNNYHRRGIYGKAIIRIVSTESDGFAAVRDYRDNALDNERHSQPYYHRRKTEKNIKQAHNAARDRTDNRCGEDHRHRSATAHISYFCTDNAADKHYRTRREIKTSRVQVYRNAERQKQDIRKPAKIQLNRAEPRKQRRTRKSTDRAHYQKADNGYRNNAESFFDILHFQYPGQPRSYSAFIIFAVS